MAISGSQSILEGGPPGWSTIALEGWEWRHEERLRTALLRTVSAPVVTLSASRPEFEAAVELETEARWRLWFAKPDSARAEFALGSETLVVVAKGDHWWSSSPLMGRRTGDADFRTGLGPGMAMIDLRRCLSGFAGLRIVGHRQIAGREGIAILADSGRPFRVEETSDSVWDSMPAVSIGDIASEFGLGADAFEFVVDQEFGILLSAEAMIAGASFRRCEVTEVSVDEPMESTLFIAV